MRDTVERLRRLLAEGYCVEGIESDHGAIVTTLSKGSRVVVLRVLPSEATRLLALPSPRRS